MKKAENGQEDNDNKITSYEQLLLAYSKYIQNDVEAAGTAMENVNADYLDADSKAVYDEINEKVNAEYIATMYAEGYQAYNSQNYQDAATDLQKVVDIDENYQDGNALYYLAQSYRKNEDIEKATQYYQKMVELYPNTERAANSQNYLDEFQNQTAE